MLKLKTTGDYIEHATPKDNVKVGDAYCTVCGRKMGKNGFFFHLAINGEILPVSYEGDRSQGFWPVGSECAKLFESSLLTK
jgi:hypothetical protein